VQAAPALAERRRNRPIDRPDQAAGPALDRPGRAPTASANGGLGGLDACPHRRLLAAQVVEVLLEVVAVRLDSREQRPALAAGGCQRVLALDHRGARLGDLVLLREDRVGGVLLLLLELLELVREPRRLALELADARDDHAVLRGDPLEEGGPVEHVREAVGLEDHGEDVRLVVLVHLDEARRQRVRRLVKPRAQPHQPVLRHLEAVLHALHLRALLLQRALQSRLARRVAADVALKAADPRRVRRDVGREHAGTCPLLLNLTLLALDLVVQRAALARHRERQVGQQAEGYRKEEVLLHE
jgi:hypothetical protein